MDPPTVVGEEDLYCGDVPRTLDEMTWPRHTDRLVIRPVTPADAGELWALQSDPALNRWTTKLYTTREEFDADWERLASARMVAQWDGRIAALLLVTQQDACSQADMTDRAAGQKVELGWIVAPWAAGQGIATEVAREGLAIASDMGVHRVEANCFAANTASWKVMEKIGMRREAHTIQESLHRDGQWYDGYGYALLTEEYRRAKREETT